MLTIVTSSSIQKNEALIESTFKRNERCDASPHCILPSCTLSLRLLRGHCHCLLCKRQWRCFLRSFSRILLAATCSVAACYCPSRKRRPTLDDRCLLPAHSSYCAQDGSLRMGSNQQHGQRASVCSRQISAARPHHSQRHHDRRATLSGRRGGGGCKLCWNTSSFFRDGYRGEQGATCHFRHCARTEGHKLSGYHGQGAVGKQHCETHQVIARRSRHRAAIARGAVHTRAGGSRKLCGCCCCQGV